MYVCTHTQLKPVGVVRNSLQCRQHTSITGGKFKSTDRHLMAQSPSDNTICLDSDTSFESFVEDTSQVNLSIGSTLGIPPVRPLSEPEVVDASAENMATAAQIQQMLDQMKESLALSNDKKANEVLGSLTTFREEICERITTEVATVRADFTSLQSEVGDLKAEVADLKTELEAAKTSISTLTEEVNSLKNSSGLELAATVAEIEERHKRSHNLIIFGFEETPANAPNPQPTDAETIRSYLASLVPTITPADIRNISRMGKLVAGKIRPVRVVLNSAALAREVLVKSRKNPRPNTKVRSDLTPTEQSELRCLRETLAKMEGDTHTIRYVNGRPKIVSRQGNGNRQ